VIERRHRKKIARIEEPRFIVVTGLSGAGKSQAIRTLEDLGYFCVDNLPLALIPTFAALTVGRDRQIRRAAVVVDIRGGRELSRFPAMYRKLKIESCFGVSARHAGRIRLRRRDRLPKGCVKNAAASRRSVSSRTASWTRLC
jgi:hypothetical protein